MGLSWLGLVLVRGVALVDWIAQSWVWKCDKPIAGGGRGDATVGGEHWRLSHVVDV
jgi:hypothetical protein